MQAEKSNNLPSIYSQVIFKNQNDKEAEDMVNSYKYKSSTPGRYKKWTPEFSFEERYKKKRLREDQYISQIETSDRPILVIKKKHEYKGMKNPKVFNEDQLESYYKISENTQLVNDLEAEIREMENFIRRHTFVHKPKDAPNDGEGLATVFKIEGQEFLPEGFIELDPLLLKDEYEFDNKIDEKNFDKEQRQMKELRKRQYQQRNNNKLRDVTIYVMDEKKNNVVEFLEKWYEKHKRKINEAEIEYVAKVLDVDPKQLEYFQDLYIKIKQIQYSKDAGDVSKSTGKNGKDKVESKYIQNESPYVPTFLNKYEKKSQKLPRYNIKKKNSVSPVLNTKELDKTLIKTLGQSKEINNDPQESQFNEEHQSKPNLKLQESQKKFEANLEQYFDTEIHSILDKMKGAKDNQKQAQNGDINNDYVELYKKKISQNEIDAPRLSQADKNQRKSENDGNQRQGQRQSQNQKNDQKMNQVNKDQSFEVPQDNHLRISLLKPQTEEELELDTEANKLPKRFTISAIGQEKKVTISKLQPIFIGNEYFYQTVEQLENPLTRAKKDVISTRNDQGHLLSEFVVPIDKQGAFYENEVREIPDSYEGDQGKLVVVVNEQKEEVFSQILRPTKAQIFKEDFSEQLDKPNFRQSNIDISDNIKTHQLAPVEFEGNEYKVVVEEMSFPEQNFDQINVIVYDSQNNIVSNNSVDPHLKGSFYNSSIEGLDGKFYLVTKNNHGETLDEMELGNALNQEVNNQVTVDEEEDIKVIKLNPIAIGDRFVRQEIKLSPEAAILETFNDLEEVMESKEVDPNQVSDHCKSVYDHDKEQIIIKTQNENGDILSEFYVPKEYAQYIDQNFDDILVVDDEKGKPRASIAVKQRNTKILRSYSLRPTFIGDKFYNQTINEVLDENDPVQNKAVLITQDEEGNTIDVQELDPKLISDNYYNQITNQMIDNFGNKTSDLVLFNDDKDVIAHTKISTTLQPKFLSNIYDNIIEEIVNENESKDENAQKDGKDKNDDQEVTEVLVMKKQDDGTFEILQEEVKLNPKQKKQFYEDIFNQIPQQGGRRSLAEDRRKDRSKTHHGMPENYKFLQSEKIGGKQKIEDDVLDYINQALEDADLIRKIDDQQVKVIKESLKNVPENESVDEEEAQQNNRKKSALNDQRKSKAQDQRKSTAQDQRKSNAQDQRNTNDVDRRKSTAQDQRKSVAEDQSQPILQNHRQSVYGEQRKSITGEQRKSISGDHRKSISGERRKSTTLEEEFEDRENAKRLSKFLDKNKVEEFIAKNSLKEIFVDKDKKKEAQNDAKKKKSINRPKFNSYAKKYEDKQSKSAKNDMSLIEEIYGKQDIKTQEEDPQQDILDSENDDAKNEKTYWESEKQIEEVKQMNQQLKIKKAKDEPKVKSKKSAAKNQNQNNESSEMMSFEKQPEQSDNTSFKSFERHESDLKQSLKDVLEEENQKRGNDFMKKLQEKTGFHSQDELLEDFHKFCLTLQRSSKYKESVLFATLFFYYLERKKNMPKRVK